ncbi:AraC family transcriptional regulator [Microbacterium sulfonylureivorans]|uniref:AraC family transcriptional regulator n=1 Tax=Microbacterium sulfonylureivorans TaxID=2486854 RepID=UPI0013E039AB|nr:AraC family transcriptional regulator [Microbacterium sulfonylureivorans]
MSPTTSPPSARRGSAAAPVTSDDPDVASTSERAIQDLRGVGPFLSVGRLRYLTAQDRLPEQVHPHVLVLAFPLRGDVEFVVEDRVVPVRAGEMIHISPGTPYSTSVGAQPRGEMLWLLLSTGSAASTADTAIANAVRALTTQQPHARRASELGVQLLTRVVDSEASSDALWRPWAEAMCTAAVLELVRGNERVASSGDPVHPGVARAVAWVRNHIEDEITVGDLVSEAGMSTTNFYQQFTRAFGTSPKDYVLRCKIDRAQELLREERESITSIAFRLGFSSSQQFGAAFRRYVGVTPTQFRASVESPPAGA